jgi:hypothetical protein
LWGRGEVAIEDALPSQGIGSNTAGKREWGFLKQYRGNL